jgi:hypothetical protein
MPRLKSGRSLRETSLHLPARPAAHRRDDATHLPHRAYQPGSLVANLISAEGRGGPNHHPTFERNAATSRRPRTLNSFLRSPPLIIISDGAVITIFGVRQHSSSPGVSGVRSGLRRMQERTDDLAVLLGLGLWGARKARPGVTVCA